MERPHVSSLAQQQGRDGQCHQQHQRHWVVRCPASTASTAIVEAPCSREGGVRALQAMHTSQRGVDASECGVSAGAHVRVQRQACRPVTQVMCAPAVRSHAAQDSSSSSARASLRTQAGGHARVCNGHWGSGARRELLESPATSGAQLQAGRPASGKQTLLKGGKRVRPRFFRILVCRAPATANQRQLGSSHRRGMPDEAPIIANDDGPACPCNQVQGREQTGVERCAE